MDNDATCANRISDFAAGIFELDGMPHMQPGLYCLNMLALLMHSMLMCVLSMHYLTGLRAENSGLQKCLRLERLIKSTNLRFCAANC